jgi:hypothetical protein
MRSRLSPDHKPRVRLANRRILREHLGLAAQANEAGFDDKAALGNFESAHGALRDAHKGKPGFVGFKQRLAQTFDYFAARTPGDDSSIMSRTRGALEPFCHTRSNDTDRIHGSKAC